MGTLQASTGPGKSTGLLALATVTLVAALALASPAAAKRNLFVGGVFGPGVASLEIGAGGALSPVAGSPYGTPPTDGVALTPDGRHLYSTSAGTQQILAFDVGLGGALAAIPGLTFTGPPDPDPNGIAISPDGRHAYVADPGPEAVRVFSVGAAGTLSPAGLAPLGGAENTSGVGITPNGNFLYASAQKPPVAGAVYGFAIGADGSLTQLPTPFVETTAGTEALSITPDGRYLYVASAGTGGVQAYLIGTDGSLADAVPGSPFATGVGHDGLAVSPRGDRLFVANAGSPGAIESFAIDASGSLTPAPGSPFAATDETAGIALTPDGSRLYSSGDLTAGNVSAFDVAPGGALTPIAGSPFPSGVGLPIFSSLAVSPNQAPTASFTAVQEERTNTVRFDAAGSSDADGTIARYDWEFGDGTSLPNGGPAPAHTYPGPGAYTATLTLTDAEGCTTSFVFTGQTAACNGPAARAERQVQVRAPAAAPAPEVDRRPPLLRLLGPRHQRLDGAIELRVSCDEPCTVTARGQLILSARDNGKVKPERRFELPLATLTLPAGADGAPKLKLRKKPRRAGRRALLRGGAARAKIVVDAVDATGNRSPQARRTIKLIPPRRD